MAAVNTEHGREIVELNSKEISVLPSALKNRSDGMISWTSTDGRYGIAEIFPDTEARAVAAQTRYCSASLSAIGRTHMLQTPSSDSISKIGRPTGADRRFGSKSFAGIMVD